MSRLVHIYARLRLAKCNVRTVERILVVNGRTYRCLISERPISINMRHITRKCEMSRVTFEPQGVLWFDMPGAIVIEANWHMVTEKVQ